MARGTAAMLIWLVAFAGVGAVSASGADATIVSVVANPTAYGDRGEHVVVAFPPDTDPAGWQVTDGETTVGIGNATVGGRVALATHPAAARNLTSHRVVGLDGRLALANDGEVIELRYRGRTVDRVRYERAPEGQVYVRDDDGWSWRPIGASDLAPVTVGSAAARLFVLPDNPEAPIAALADARERLLLSAYSFTSARAVRVLCSARRRGVTVAVAVDAEPVGGLQRREAAQLDALTACGVGVSVLGAEHGRYAFYHAKYAVIDDVALVLTENWKPAGTGGRSSRGWGAQIASRRLADALAATFHADTDAHDAVAWEPFRRGRSFPSGPPPAAGTYPSRIPPRTVTVGAAELLVGPDNAERAVIDELDDATETILVEQVSVDDGPFASALLRAARRGVRVRVLVSGAWYAEPENEAFVERLRAIADREGLRLDAQVASPRSRFEKIHAKGAIIDGDTVVLGSLNWNLHSARQNREVVLVLRGEAPASYFAEVFRADWRGGRWRLPAGVVGAVAASTAVAVVVARRTLVFAG